MKKIHLGPIVALTLSLLLISSASAADGWLNLPATPVTMEIVYPGVESTFITTLSNIPPGYDITDGTYLGWCVDRTLYYPAPPPAAYDVILYSSYYPPASLSGEQWDMVNYILNHKQGTPLDIQEAIWYFIDGFPGPYIPGSPEGMAMVNDALANGGGYVPGLGEVIVVICYPVDHITQITIIELPRREFKNPKQFTASGAFGGFTAPEIAADGLNSKVFELHSGPRIWWQVTYHVENTMEFLGGDYDGEGHYFILWDKWGGNLMALPSPPEAFNEKTNTVTLENANSFVINPSGYKAYVGNGIPLTDDAGGSAVITLHTGDQQQNTNPGTGRGTTKDGKSYDADIRWEIGWLDPGESRELVIYIAPGKNPAGKLQFSSPGCYCMNTGPRVRVYGDPDYEDFLYAIDRTIQLWVTVEF